jgi:hypothetical protein
MGDILDDRILILLDPVDNRDLELSVPVSRYPEFYIADHLNSKHPGIAALAVVGLSFDSYVFPSA